MVEVPPCPNFCYGFVGICTNGIRRTRPCEWRGCPYEKHEESPECLRHLRFFEFDSLVWGGDLGLEDFLDPAGDEEAPTTFNIVTQQQMESQHEHEERALPGQKWCEMDGCPRPAFGRYQVCKWHKRRLKRIQESKTAMRLRTT